MGLQNVLVQVVSSAINRSLSISGCFFCSWISDLGYEPLASLKFCSACGPGLAILAPFYCRLASLQWWSQATELLGGKLCKQAGHCTITRTHTS